MAAEAAASATRTRSSTGSTAAATAGATAGATVGAAAAEEVLAERKATGASFGMPSAGAGDARSPRRASRGGLRDHAKTRPFAQANTVTQLLMTYVTYDARAAAARADATDYRAELQKAREAGDERCPGKPVAGFRSEFGRFCSKLHRGPSSEDHLTSRKTL